MTTLHDRLATLAEDAPPGGPVPDLWERGRRYHRQRRTGTVVMATAVVLGLLALGTLNWWRAQPEPAPANGTPALPQKIWMPSPFLPGTDDAGPLGQLAAVQSAERTGWGGTSSGIVGISATAGEYRFLDLPEASENVPALAPDGRHVAYWYTGETRQSPNSDSGPVVGVAVYDTTTGELVRHPVATDHGLWIKSLVWADSARLVFRHMQYMGGDGGDEMLQSAGNQDSGLLVWEPGSGADPVRLSGIDGEVEDSTGEGQLLVDGGDDMAWVDLDDPGATVRFPRPNVVSVYSMAADTGGSRLAAPLGNRNPNTLSVVRFDADGTSNRQIPDSERTFAAWAWLDEDHVAAVRRVGSGYDASALMRVDVHTGESTEMLRFPPNTYGTQTQVATDLLGAPAAERPAPPQPLDPRVVAVAGITVVLGGLGALLLWRRRVRA
jgi:hypothetical protein